VGLRNSGLVLPEMGEFMGDAMKAPLTKDAGRFLQRTAGSRELGDKLVNDAR
jgi:hypothetical protein